MKTDEKTSSFRKMSDDDLLKAVVQNDNEAIVYFFYQKFLPTFQYHIYNIFPQKVDVQEMVDELFLYLYEDQWRRLKTFNGSASLSTWISVISYRFFKNFKHAKIDSNGLITISSQWEAFTGEWVHSHDAGIRMDVEKAITSITNDRDRKIARRLFIEDKEYQAVADEFDLTVDYVYTVKNRITKQLRLALNSYN